MGNDQSCDTLGSEEYIKVDPDQDLDQISTDDEEKTDQSTTGKKYIFLFFCGEQNVITERYLNHKIYEYFQNVFLLTKRGTLPIPLMEEWMEGVYIFFINQ